MHCKLLIILPALSVPAAHAHAPEGAEPPGRYRLSWAKLLARVVHVDHGVCPPCGGAGGPDGPGVYPSLSQRDGAELARPADRAAGRVRSSRLIHPGATLVDFGIVNNVWECTDWLIVGRKTGPKLGGRTSLKEKQNTSIYVVRNCLHEGRHWFICLTSMKRYT